MFSDTLQKWLATLSVEVIANPTRWSNTSQNEFFDVFFDVEFQHDPEETQELEIMVEKGCDKTNRNYLEKKGSQPIKIKNMSTAFCGKILVNRASFLYECQFTTQDVEENLTNGNNVSKCNNGIFPIWSKTTWLNKVSTPESCNQAVRNASVSNKPGSILLSIWEVNF